MAVRRAGFGPLLALVVAAPTLSAIGIEGLLSFRKVLGQGRSLIEAQFLFLRYFTNIAVAILRSSPLSIAIARPAAYRCCAGSGPAT